VGFSSEWEEIYRQGAQNSVWPWSDLVSYVMRYARPDHASYRVLELGFGAGANISFFLSVGADYHGTEGSATAVDKVRDRFAGVVDFHVACCDFTKTIPFDGPFDLVVDRSSLTHNDLDSIRECLQRLNSLMRPRAKFIGIDWFSTANADFPSGMQLADYYTRSGFSTGQFKDVGVVHFSDAEHLLGLLTAAGFVVERLEHKQIDVAFPADAGRMAWWNFVAVKS
jgi:hypothetical protein